MIQLSSRNFLIVDHQGARHSLSFGDFRQELVRSFRDCGVTETWVAEHIALVIEEQLLAGRLRDSGPLTETELNTLVASVLVASGYADVARRHGCLRQDDQGPERDDFTAWDRGRVERILATAFPLAAAAIRALVDEVTTACKALGLAEVNAGLIRELGEHFLHRGRRHDATAAVTDSPWLAVPEDLVAQAAAGAAGLVRDGVLRVLPVSRLIPRIRLEFDLLLFGERLGAGPLLELACLPPLACACREARLFFAACRTRVCALDTQAAQHPGHLIARGLDALVADRCPPRSRRAANALRDEIIGVFRDEIVRGLDFDVVFSVR